MRIVGSRHAAAGLNMVLNDLKSPWSFGPRHADDPTIMWRDNRVAASRRALFINDYAII